VAGGGLWWSVGAAEADDGCGAAVVGDRLGRCVVTDGAEEGAGDPDAGVLGVMSKRAVA